MKIYLVTGSTGAYEDRYEWYVKAFKHEGEAEDYLTRLKALYELLPRGDYEMVRESMQEFMDLCNLDPNFFEDYLTGTYYNIQEVEFVE